MSQDSYPHRNQTSSPDDILGFIDERTSARGHQLSMARLQKDDVIRWLPYSIGNPSAPSDKAPILAPLKKNAYGNFKGAKVNDPTTWATHTEALSAAAELGGKSGVGFMLGKLKKFTVGGFDLDTCIGESRKPEPWAKAVLNRIKTYAEISPSGKGVKLFYLISTSNLPAVRALLRKQGSKFILGSGDKHPPAIEAYIENRYFTVTGDRYTDAKHLVELPVSEVEWLLDHAQAMAANQENSLEFDVSTEMTWIADIKKCSAKTHDSSLRLATKRAFAGASEEAIVRELREIFHTVPRDCRKRQDGSDRWKDRYATIPKIARDAIAFMGKTEAETLDRLNSINWDDLTHLDPEDDSDIAAIANIDLSENGLIEFFGDKFANTARYDHSQGKWFLWNGNIWGRNDTDKAKEFARRVSTRLADADSKNPSVKALRKVSTWEAVERAARRLVELAVNANAWDRDPWLLGTPNGTIDLRTGKLHASRQSDLITKQTAVAPISSISSFDAERDCPVWLQFLGSALKSDQDAIRFLQQWLGYSLTGDISEQSLVFVWGPGGSGKSTAINTFADIIGDYAINIDMATLTASRYDRHSTELARLRGARMARASETEEGRAWAETRIKMLTGGDTVTARFMRQDDFEFKPEFKLTVFGNNRPSIHSVDEGMKRRFIILPFTEIPAKKDLHLADKLRLEWPAILTWAILGCLDWQQNKLIRPKVVLAATESYFAEQDTFQLWIEAHCELGKRYAATSQELWSSWDDFCREAGEESGSLLKTFPEQMQRRGFVPTQNLGPRRVRGFKGIRVRDEYPNLNDDDMDV